MRDPNIPVDEHLHSQAQRLRVSALKLREAVKQMETDVRMYMTEADECEARAVEFERAARIYRATQ